MPSDRLAAHVCSLLATYVVHSTLFLAAAWLLLSRCRSHAWTCRGWRLAAMLGLVTAPLQIATGFSPFAVRLPGERVAAESTIVPPNEVPNTATVDVPSQHFVEPRRLEDVVDAPHDLAPATFEVASDESEPVVVESPIDVERPDTDVRVADVGGDSEADEATPIVPVERVEDEPAGVTIAADRSVRRHDRGWITLLSAVGLGVIGLGLSRLVVLYARMWRWSRGGTPLRCSAARRTLERLRRTRGVRRAVELVERDDLAHPAACGGRRWRILLPTGLAGRVTPAALEAILAHELAHLVRRDGPWLWVGQLLKWCLPFQPLNRLAVARWQRASEFLCDDWAVAGGVRATTLARCLTDLAEVRSTTTPAVATTAISTRPVLVERVESLLTDPKPRTNRGANVGLAITGLAVAGAIPLVPAVTFSTTPVGTDARTTALVTPLDEDAPMAVRTLDSIAVRPGTADAGDEWEILDAELRELSNELDRVRRRAKSHPSDELRRLTGTLTLRRDALDERRRALDERLRPPRNGERR